MVFIITMYFFTPMYEENNHAIYKNHSLQVLTKVKRFAFIHILTLFKRKRKFETFETLFVFFVHRTCSIIPPF